MCICLCASYRGQHVWKRYYEDYLTLNIDLIREVVLTEDPSRPFVLSSPSNGLETLREGWVSKNPKDPRYGDCKYKNGRHSFVNYSVNNVTVTVVL